MGPEGHGRVGGEGGGSGGRGHTLEPLKLSLGPRERVGMHLKLSLGCRAARPERRVGRVGVVGMRWSPLSLGPRAAGDMKPWGHKARRSGRKGLVSGVWSP